MRINHLLGTLSAACLLIVLTAASAHAQRPKRVGIAVTVRVNVSVAEAQELADALGKAIVDEFKVDVISGEETDRRLPMGGMPEECVANIECRNDLGRRLDADELLLLVVLRIGDDLQIDATWAEIASGDSASRAKVTITPSDKREEVLAKAAPGLLPHIKKPVETITKREIIVVPGQTQPEAGRDIPLGSWIAGGIGVGTLVGGTVFALSAMQKFNALDEAGCRDNGCDSSRIDSLNSRALAADILFGVSGALAATAVILYFTGPKHSSEKNRESLIKLQPGPGDVGFALGGSF